MYTPLDTAELNGCRILPYYWNFTEFFHASHSQPGTTQRIKGMVGKLYLKGDWRPLAPFLILGSELHAGSKRSNSQGYFRLLEPPPASTQRHGAHVKAGIHRFSLKRYAFFNKSLHLFYFPNYIGKSLPRDSKRKTFTGIKEISKINSLLLI